MQDADNYVGVSGRAADTFDQYKLEKAPVFRNQYVRLAILHPTWGNYAGQYGVDLRSANPGVKTWDFTVDSTEPNAKAVLSWPNAAQVSRNVSLTLTDIATGQTRDLRSNSSYVWTTGDKPGSRAFRLEAVRTDVTSTLRITDAVARPVSSRAGGATSGVNVNYNLSISANVEVKVLGATGNVVRHLTSRSSRTAGINQHSWDLRSDTNTSVPAGTYTVDIKAVSVDGKSTARQISTVIVTR